MKSVTSEPTTKLSNIFHDVNVPKISNGVFDANESFNGALTVALAAAITTNKSGVFQIVLYGLRPANFNQCLSICVPRVNFHPFSNLHRVNCLFLNIGFFKEREK